MKPQYVLVRITAPDEQELARFDGEQAAVERARTLEAADLPIDTYHEIRCDGRAIWTSEAGELERMT